VGECAGAYSRAGGHPRGQRAIPTRRSSDLYHGAEGIRDIALRIHSYTSFINELLAVYEYGQENEQFFDTLKITLPDGLTQDSFRSEEHTSELQSRENPLCRRLPESR